MLDVNTQLDTTLLPQTAEYALRAMSLLAALPPGGAMRAADLAEAADIPPAYLSKIMRRLVLDGLVLSQKGHRGGFRLGKEPKEIRFCDVLHAVAFEVKADDCAFGWGNCNTSAPCPLHAAWTRMKGAFVDWSARTTLADVDIKAFAHMAERKAAAASKVSELVGIGRKTPG